MTIIGGPFILWLSVFRDLELLNKSFVRCQ